MAAVVAASTLTQKIIEISKNLPSLVKDTDSDAGWKYPTIDQYYDKIAKRVREGGMNWTISETESEYVGDNIMRYKYRFVVRALSVDLADEVFISIYHPWQEAQTTGSAMSYAEKIFLRTYFKIVTGEPDADAFAKGKKGASKPRTVSKAAEPDVDEFTAPAKSFEKQVAEMQDDNPVYVEPAVEAKVEEEDSFFDGDDFASETPATDYAVRASILIKAVNACDSKAELREWRYNADNVAKIEELKANSGEEFDRVQAAYRAKVDQFKKKD